MTIFEPLFGKVVFLSSHEDVYRLEDVADAYPTFHYCDLYVVHN